MKCVDCKNEAVKGKIRCLNCLEVGQVSSYTRYYRLKRNGLCVRCGKVKTNGRSCCSLCLERKYKLKKVKNGGI